MEKNLWNTDCRRFDNEPLTDEMIERAEIKLGVKLPAEYIELIKERNGGSLNCSCFPVDGKDADKLGKSINIDHIMGIGKDNGGILQSLFFAEEFELKPKLIPFYGDGDSWICFDYNKKGPFKSPVISYVHSHSGEVTEISPDFKTFIEQLREVKDAE